MKNPTPETLEAAYQALRAGAKQKEVLEASGLNYSQLWLYTTDKEMPDSERIPNPDSPEGLQAIAHARGFRRTKTGWRHDATAEAQSWGYIAVRCRMPENRVRKLFADHTRISDEGLRIGRGGRWVADCEAAYRGDRPDEQKRAVLGTDIPAEKLREFKREARHAKPGEVELQKWEITPDGDFVPVKKAPRKPRAKKTPAAA